MSQNVSLTYFTIVARVPGIARAFVAAHVVVKAKAIVLTRVREETWQDWPRLIFFKRLETKLKISKIKQ